MTIDREELDEQENASLGFMEFFDWLARQADDALVAAADRLGISLAEHEVRDGLPLARCQRYDIGLAVWQAS